jgi:hypothetical protein
MNRPDPPLDPAIKGRPILEEADIGSGEKTPAQEETEEMIRQIPPLPPSGRPAGNDKTGQRDDAAAATRPAAASTNR